MNTNIAQCGATQSTPTQIPRFLDVIQKEVCQNRELAERIESRFGTVILPEAPGKQAYGAEPDIPENLVPLAVTLRDIADSVVATNRLLNDILIRAQS